MNVYWLRWRCTCIKTLVYLIWTRNHRLLREHKRQKLTTALLWVNAAIKVSTEAPKILSYSLHFYHHLYCTSLFLSSSDSPFYIRRVSRESNFRVFCLTLVWHRKSLTVDIKVNCILGVVNAVHDLTAIGSRVTGTKLDHCQWGVTYILRVTGHWDTVSVAWAYFDEPVLRHQHCGFDLSFNFGPFDPQVIFAINCSIGTDGWCWGWNGGEEAGEIYLPWEGPSNRSDYW